MRGVNFFSFFFSFSTIHVYRETAGWPILCWPVAFFPYYSISAVNLLFPVVSILLDSCLPFRNTSFYSTAQVHNANKMLFSSPSPPPYPPQGSAPSSLSSATASLPSWLMARWTTLVPSLFHMPLRSLHLHHSSAPTSLLQPPFPGRAASSTPRTTKLEGTDRR